VRGGLKSTQGLRGEISRENFRLLRGRHSHWRYPRVERRNRLRGDHRVERRHASRLRGHRVDVTRCSREGVKCRVREPSSFLLQDLVVSTKSIFRILLLPQSCGGEGDGRLGDVSNFWGMCPPCSFRHIFLQAIFGPLRVCIEESFDHPGFAGFPKFGKGILFS
jgi:hypothetical protein